MRQYPVQRKMRRFKKAKNVKQILIPDKISKNILGLQRAGRGPTFCNSYIMACSTSRLNDHRQNNTNDTGHHIGSCDVAKSHTTYHTVRLGI